MAGTLDGPVDVSEFDFRLPAELVAQEPPAERGGSRLLLLSRETGAVGHAAFADLGRHLQPGDLLVVNDTRVYPARLRGRRVPSGGRVECLLLARDRTAGQGGQPADPQTAQYLALVHPGQRLAPGARMVFEREGVRLEGEIVGRHFHGRRTVRLWTADGGGVDQTIDRIGHIPLPPYITREDRPSDRERYQTVYARSRGSVAAPTAGLHFSGALLASLESQGIERTSVTLHVGYGTFEPVRVERIEEHRVDAEEFAVTQAAADALTRARRAGRRIIAVGTTTVRALESLTVDADGRVHPASGATSLFVRPGHHFQLVDGLITNFHLPRSSLLMLVAAFAGRDRVLAAYREAVEKRYRFYSYGDVMLVG
jgi:S-adenosylmethionine:tRNA ribosyltransferase-isomerase